MKKIFVFKVFLLGFAWLISIFFLGKTFFEAKNFHKFDKKIEAKVIRWEIDKGKKGKFKISAIYEYDIEGKKINGKTIFNKNFNNYPSAFSELNHLAKKKWKVWYSSKDDNISSLEKNFPTKHCVYSIISIAVLLYFSLFQKKFNGMWFNLLT